MICPVCHLELQKIITMVDSDQGPIEIETLEFACPPPKHSIVGIRDNKIFKYSLKLPKPNNLWILGGRDCTSLYKWNDKEKPGRRLQEMASILHLMPLKLKNDVVDTHYMIEKLKKLIVFS